MVIPGRIPTPDGVSRTVRPGGRYHPSPKHNSDTIYDSAQIRRLTPRECFRLQGWEDEYFERAALVNSDNQLYKQAGNGVTVTVVKRLARRMAVGREQNKG